MRHRSRGTGTGDLSLLAISSDRREAGCGLRTEPDHSLSSRSIEIDPTGRNLLRSSGSKTVSARVRTARGVPLSDSTASGLILRPAPRKPYTGMALGSPPTPPCCGPLFFLSYWPRHPRPQPWRTRPLPRRTRTGTRLRTAIWRTAPAHRAWPTTRSVITSPRARRTLIPTPRTSATPSPTTPTQSSFHATLPCPPLLQKYSSTISQIPCAPPKNPRHMQPTLTPAPPSPHRSPSLCGVIAVSSCLRR